ncbi:RimJ/RimL family protein N-acetyltransferase [Saccharothrix ecbatanensis]|uniref:RimJ/RimL family protein N-acetyltransferase n=1 Tax=Saccharothrix ecbatanensis TaxID=1105145 RepID=A0A7W9HIK7_9PSEU|nr:GNAT family N-acetyltransferase [Saccharothrix ecbatanensis]MBB5802711.1 RimJ/RimL family protein N-acetyltransferase [Saccharothrix ecbatanensis]
MSTPSPEDARPVTGDAIPGRWPEDAVVRTARLRIEPVRVGHAEEMAAVLGDPALYSITGGAPPTVADLTARYRRWERPWSDDGHEGWLNWTVLREADDVAVGTVQATTAVGVNGLVAEVAWVVGVPFQGYGYATESAAAVVGWLVGRGARAVHAHIAPDHPASEAVARRIGMRASGEFRDDGEQRWRLHALSARTTSTWSGGSS